MCWLLDFHVQKRHPPGPGGLLLSGPRAVASGVLPRGLPAPFCDSGGPLVGGAWPWPSWLWAHPQGMTVSTWKVGSASQAVGCKAKEGIGAPGLLGAELGPPHQQTRGKMPKWCLPTLMLPCRKMPKWCLPALMLPCRMSSPNACHHRLLPQEESLSHPPLQEAPQDQQVCLNRPPLQVLPLPLPWDPEHVRFRVCPARVEPVFPTIAWIFRMRNLLVLKARCSGASFSCPGPPGWAVQAGAWTPCSLGRASAIVITPQLLVAGLRIWVLTLLHLCSSYPSHCGPLFVSLIV